MVAVHPSLFKNVDTRSANAFGDEGIAGFLTLSEAAKDAILAAGSFYYSIFFFLFLGIYTSGNHVVNISPKANQK